MASRVSGSNNNYKLFARIRPIEYSQKMLEISGDTTLSIRDPSQKNSEKQSFQFNGIFDQKASQDKVWSQTTEPILQKLIEGHNGVVFSYGQTGAGKSYTIFGEDERYSVSNNMHNEGGRSDRRGSICRTVEYLFRKAEELQEIREFVITCSMAEIYLDQVRDLGKAYLTNSDDPQKRQLGLSQGTLLSNYEKENLQIKESTNGQVMIQGITQVTLNSIQDLYEMLQAGFLLRDKFETKGTQIWSRAHTIFTLNLVQKDKEADMIPFLNSTIQFVDLAGSERIAKSLTEGHKFQEAILINSSLTSLSKCLQMIAKSSKSVPYRDTHLTKVVQNCMTYSSHTILFINLNPSESNYEECLSSLQYGDRTKNVFVGQKNTFGGAIGGGGGGADRQSVSEEFVMNVGGTFPGQEKAIKKLTDEISDLKSKLEFNNREHREKLQKIQESLGLEIDLDKVLNANSRKELFDFKVKKEAMVQLENVKKYNKELENKIDKLQSFIKEQQSEERIREEENTRIKLEQSEVIKQLKDRLAQYRQQSETEMQKLSSQREKEIKEMIERSNQLLEEKANVILNLPQEVERKTQDNQKLNEVKKATQFEAEKQYKSQTDSLKTEYAKLLANTKEQYEFFLKQKNEEMETYCDQLKKYREKKKNQIGELNIELQDLYEIIQKQSQIITKIETGYYSKGIRSFNIPQRDKPHYPNRQKHKNLFQILDKSHLQSTLNSKQNLNKPNLKKSSLMGTKNNNFLEGTSSSNKPFPQQGSLNKENNQNNHQESQQQRSFKQEKEYYDNLDDLIDLQVNLQKIIQGKQYDQFETLKIYTQRIKDSLQQSLLRERDFKKRVEEFEQINSTVDIKQLQKERDEYKHKYFSEIKKHNQSRIAIESQKRLISSKLTTSYAKNHPNALPSVQYQQPQISLVRPNTVANDRRIKSGSINYNM